MAFRAMYMMALMSFVCALSASATDLNKDFTVEGSGAAYGITFVLYSPKTFTAFFDGYAGGTHCFGYFTTRDPNSVPATSRYVKWTSFHDRFNNNQILPGMCIHVGWTTAENDYRIMYGQWLDQFGNSIPWDFVLNISGHFVYRNGVVQAVLRNDSNLGQEGGGERPDVLVRNMAAEAFPHRWHLDELNYNNTVLNDSLRNQPAGSWFAIPNGSEVAITLDLGVDPVPPEYYVVARYEVESWYNNQHGHSIAMDWIQDPAREPAAACCFQDGSCQFLYADECAAAGGQFLGGSVPCDPNPCQATPSRPTTWGKVKVLFR